MAGLHVVALISGGKDSFFSLLHCQSNGHKVVALANLHPPEHESNGHRADDLESYMYQTIGHAVIPQYEPALGLPLYRQEILGHAVNQTKNYGPPPPPLQGKRSAADGEEEDETESLVPLLKLVLAAHPEVNAVSTGAIMSDYQRTRVESVALRLGLVPLSYLWQWPFLAGQTPDSLLRHMAAVGQDARIVKVASGGLDEAFLWQNVADTRTIQRLSVAAGRFGTPDDGAVLGEGGEYETLAIAGPSPLWKGRIVVDAEAVEVVQGEAGSASVRIKASTVEMVEDGGSLQSEVARPDVFDARFQSLLEDVCAMVNGDSLSLIEHDLVQISHETSSALFSSMAAEVGHAFVLPAATGSGSEIQEQTRSIMNNAMEQLSQRGLRPSDVVYTTIILRDMAEFASVNKIYGSYFTEPNPPARLTIACASVLPIESHLSISMTAAPGPREGLHVQSRSYWAPANIGPYSQAISFTEQTGSDATRSAVFVSGQIPLVPASMELLHMPGESATAQFAHEAVLALQHLDRIGRRMDVRRWSYGLVFVTVLDEADLARRAAVGRKIWQAYHHRTTDTVDEDVEDVDDEEFDVWHLKHGHQGGNSTSTENRREGLWSAGSDGRIPPLTLAVVDSLPRGAGVEWVGFGSRAADGRIVESKPLHLTSLLRSFSAQPGRLWSVKND